MTEIRPPRPRRSKSLWRWTRRAFYMLFFGLGVVIAVWSGRSFVERDTVELITRSSGDAMKGSSWSIFMESNWGTIRFDLLSREWQREDVPGYHFGNSLFVWLRTPASEADEGLPYPAPVPGLGGTARGFDRWGFGIGQAEFKLVYSGNRRTNTHFAARLPHWFIVLILFAIPVLAMWKQQRRDRRVRLGLCLKCGYDLRASPGRCPECGMEVAKAANA